MTSYTITEALAEIKTIAKRVEKKRGFVAQYVFRREELKDPLQASGGSVAAIAQELQAIRDLESRLIRIRRAINRANESIELTIGGDTRTLAGWLLWRREIAPGRKLFLQQMSMTIANMRNQASKQGLKVVSDDASAGKSDVIVNVSERELADEIEAMETVLGTLDGALSLRNATSMVEIAD